MRCFFFLEHDVNTENNTYRVKCTFESALRFDVCSPDLKRDNSHACEGVSDRDGDRVGRNL